MKQLASLTILIGLTISLLGLFSGLTRLQGDAQATVYQLEQDATCSDCHSATPAPLMALQPRHLVSLDAATDATDAGDCATCHTISDAAAPLPETVQRRIAHTQTQVERLRAELDAVRQTLNAEHLSQLAWIDELLAFVEADGSWGYHHPHYTRDILTEADALMRQWRTSAQPSPIQEKQEVLP